MNFGWRILKKHGAKAKVSLRHSRGIVGKRPNLGAVEGFSQVEGFGIDRKTRSVRGELHDARFVGRDDVGEHSALTSHSGALDRWSFGGC